MKLKRPGVIAGLWRYRGMGVERDVGNSGDSSCSGDGLGLGGAFEGEGGVGMRIFLPNEDGSRDVDTLRF